MTQETTATTGGHIDWRAVRENFPVTKHWTYLNSAGAGPVPREAQAAAEQFYRETIEGGDRAWEHWLLRRERARAAVARLINAEPEEIGFTTNTSSGMNLIVDALEGTGGVISCELEFPVSTVPWMHRGMVVHRLQTDEGELRVEHVRDAMTERTSVICLSHVQYSNGLRADIEAIGREKGRHRFVVNASQSAGVLPIDVKRMRIDALCATGHKWMLGGYGSGFVYLSRELLETTRPRAVSWMSTEDPFEMNNHSYSLRRDAAARAEMGCPHFAGIFSLGASAAYLLSLGSEAIEQRALALNRRLTERLTEAEWTVLSPLRREATRSAETLVAARDPQRTVRHLSQSGVAVSIKPEGFRVATHFFNDESDIERLIAALDRAELS